MYMAPPPRAPFDDPSVRAFFLLCCRVFQSRINAPSPPPPQSRENGVGTVGEQVREPCAERN
ncbi:uncharacterized protein K452DRAFT_283956 [Aplosporella prunicola CBS 121167]|uniref:Uncharacterized protein n=1 Tax=Aplosporella prunicola CBS 121167 TaxID=1176127 RepID=A0A6A6BPG9_9PEZI|nr:uncharacterized protein K452DRAFT_283956 [Aplosporella prunicola CBS 121167]KAF2145608.1 hypothetical protein K452DRAFT_283956 [Aplosporella prunicola CBS 121167]